MKSTHSRENPPRLQPPGAGLPIAERLFLRLWLAPVVSKRIPRSESRAVFERLSQKLIDQVAAIPAEKRNLPILVDPIRGLEDSSRYWSLNGVLEHLLIVTRSMESIILGLASGKIPDGKADIAKVKPKHLDRDTLPEFQAYAPGLFESLDKKLAEPGMSFDSPLPFRHPWLGDLTARQWYWLAGSHLGIHYKQAKEIMRGLAG
jgi:hypothetical protein